MGFRIEIEISENGCLMNGTSGGDEVADAIGRNICNVLGDALPMMFEEIGKKLGFKVIAIPISNNTIFNPDLTPIKKTVN